MSATEVASYDPRMQAVLRAGFEAGEGGKVVRALVLHAAGGDVKAVRAE